MAPVVVAALRGWAFLLTTVPTYRLDSHFVETHLGLLAQLLNGSDVDVRAATGEGVALLWLMGDLSSLPESPRPSRSSSNATNTYNSLVAMAVGSPRTPRIAAAMAAFGSPGNGAASASRNDKQGPAAWSEMQLTAATTEQDGYGAALQQERQAQQQQQQSHPAVADECVWGEEEEEEEEVDSLEAIVERMRDLAKNRGHASRLNKGDRATSRGTFRDLLAIIEVGGWMDGWWPQSRSDAGVCG